MPGSSGAPIMLVNNSKIVGMHKAGFKNKKNKNKANIKNIGIPMDLIINKLKTLLEEYNNKTNINLTKEILSNQMIKIFIADSFGERTCLEVSPSDMILNVKKMIIKEFNLDNEACPILHFDGEILEDNQSLISYDIINGDTITFIGRKKSKKMKIFIVDSKNKRMALDVESSDNIFKVKEKFAKKK